MADPEPEHVAPRLLRKPTQCVLWKHPELVVTSFSERFDVVETYEDSSHESTSLLKCRECGQLYFYQWFEWVDWDEGRDTQYSTFVPIDTAEQAEEMKKADMFELTLYSPRLLWGYWVGK